MPYCMDLGPKKHSMDMASTTFTIRSLDPPALFTGIKRDYPVRALSSCLQDLDPPATPVRMTFGCEVKADPSFSTSQRASWSATMT